MPYRYYPQAHRAAFYDMIADMGRLCREHGVEFGDLPMLGLGDVQVATVLQVDLALQRAVSGI